MFENNELRQKLAILNNDEITIDVGLPQPTPPDLVIKFRDANGRTQLDLDSALQGTTAQEHFCVFNNIMSQAETWRRLCKLMTDSNFEILLFSPGTLSEVPPFGFAISDDGKRYTYRDETMPATSHLVRADLTCIKPASNLYACACPTSAGSKNDAPFSRKKSFSSVTSVRQNK